MALRRTASLPPKPHASRPPPNKGPAAPWVTNLFNGNSVYEIESTHIPLRLGTWYVIIMGYLGLRGCGGPNPNQAHLLVFCVDLSASPTFSTEPPHPATSLYVTSWDAS